MAREWLVSAALLLLLVFLSSLRIAPARPGPLLASTCPGSGAWGLGGHACTGGGGGGSPLVGFGIVWFVFHTCSLSFLLLAPLLLRVSAAVGRGELRLLPGRPRPSSLPGLFTSTRRCRLDRYSMVSSKNL